MRLLALAAAILAACTPEADRPDSTATRAAAGPTLVAEEPKDFTEMEVDTTIPIGGPSLVSRVRVGSADGKGGLASEAGTFAPGAPIVVAMDLRDAPAGSAASVVIRQGDRVLLEKRQTVPTGARSVTFTIVETGDLPRGELTLEAFMGGTSAAEETITIREGAAAQ